MDVLSLPIKLRVLAAALLTLASVEAGAETSPPLMQTVKLSPTTIKLGYESMYNLDFAAAHHQFDAWQRLHPEDPMGPVSHAAAFLFDEFRGWACWNQSCSSTTMPLMNAASWRRMRT